MDRSSEYEMAIKWKWKEGTRFLGLVWTKLGRNAEHSHFLASSADGSGEVL